MSDIFQQTFNNLQRLGIVDAAGNIKNARCFHADEKVIANITITANEVSNRAKTATLSHMLNGMCICEVEYLTDGTVIFYLVDEFCQNAYKLKMKRSGKTFKTILAEMQ